MSVEAEFTPEQLGRMADALNRAQGMAAEKEEARIAGLPVIDLEQAATLIAAMVIKKLAPPEAAGLAEDAASVPGLDGVACSILADWLEDRGFPNVSERVRRMAVRPGDLLAIECPQRLSAEGRANIIASMRSALDAAGLAGHVAVVVLDGGARLKHVPIGGAG